MCQGATLASELANFRAERKLLPACSVCMTANGLIQIGENAYMIEPHPGQARMRRSATRPASRIEKSAEGTTTAQFDLQISVVVSLPVAQTSNLIGWSSFARIFDPRSPKIRQNYAMLDS